MKIYESVTICLLPSDAEGITLADITLTMLLYGC